MREPGFRVAVRVSFGGEEPLCSLQRHRLHACPAKPPRAGCAGGIGAFQLSRAMTARQPESANTDSIPRMSFLFRRALPALLCSLHIAIHSPRVGLAKHSPAPNPPANPKIRTILADLGKVQTVGQTSLSPDGKHLAWTERGHGESSRIMVSDAHGEGAEQLNAGTDCSASDPQWSPDSRALLFEGDCGKDGQIDLFVTTLSGQPQQITHLKGFAAHPAWSPDWSAHCVPLCARRYPARGSAGGHEAAFRRHRRRRPGDSASCIRKRPRRRGRAAHSGQAACLRVRLVARFAKARLRSRAAAGREQLVGGPALHRPATPNAQPPASWTRRRTPARCMACRSRCRAGLRMAHTSPSSVA